MAWHLFKIPPIFHDTCFVFLIQVDIELYFQENKLEHDIVICQWTAYHTITTKKITTRDCEAAMFLILCCLSPWAFLLPVKFPYNPPRSFLSQSWCAALLAAVDVETNVSG